WAPRTANKARCIKVPECAQPWMIQSARCSSLRAEIRRGPDNSADNFNIGVTVTCLMSGPTEAKFFRHADMLDRKVGADEKDDPADVAKTGFKEMMDGEGGLVSGWQNKMEAATAHVLSAEQLAKQHTKETAPGTAEK